MNGLNGAALVLIPCYNEEKKIALVVQEVRGMGYETLVVDDGSTDKTSDILRSLDTHFLISSDNRGKGAALQLGFRWFLDRSYDVLVMMDADGQHEAAEIPKFIRTLHESKADIVVGNRLENPGPMPFLRVCTNRFMSALLSSLAGQKIPDTQCGFRALRRRVLEKIRLSCTRFEIESEMLLEAAKEGFRIQSLPVRALYKKGDRESNIHPLVDTVRFFKFVRPYLSKKF